MKSIFRNVALLVSLLALTTPSSGQGFLKKLKDAANNTTEKMNTAVEKAGSASVGAAVPRASGPTYYVSRSGSNKNDGLSPSTALKNIQKTIDLATDGSEIRVAEGNYFGLMNRGNIIIDKPLVILGGYSEDFSERDVLKHLTTIAPDANSNGSSQGRGTIQIRSIEKPSSSLVIDGFLFNKGNAIGYNLRGEGWPEGVETPFMMREGSKGQGGPDPNAITKIDFRNNTVLFVWSYTKDLQSQGFGFRFQPGTSCTLENNIIGLTIFAGLDRTHIDSDANREAKRHDVVKNNIFFLNRITDLTIPGGGMLTRVNVDDFDDVDAIAETGGNESLTDPALFKGRLDEAYLNGFLSVSYKETTSYDPNSAANTFRSAMGMNMTGTMTSSVSMYFNRYPWQKAIDVFGAVPGCGAQEPR